MRMLHRYELSSIYHTHTHIHTYTHTHAGNRSVSRLDLSANAVTAASAASLAQLLRTSTTLQRLDLRHNELGDAGASLVADALMCSDCRVQHLDLSANSIGHKGAEVPVSVMHLCARTFVV